MQCDELWSFVENKRNKQWIWLALDVDMREIEMSGCTLVHEIKLLLSNCGHHYRPSTDSVQLHIPISKQLMQQFFQASAIKR